MLNLSKHVILTVLNSKILKIYRMFCIKHSDDVFIMLLFKDLSFNIFMHDTFCAQLG